MDKQELKRLVEYIEKTYPFHIYLNQDTTISNVLLYKLLQGAKEAAE